MTKSSKIQNDTVFSFDKSEKTLSYYLATMNLRSTKYLLPLFSLQAVAFLPSSGAFQAGFRRTAKFRGASYIKDPLLFVATNDDDATTTTPLAFTDIIFDEIAGQIQEHFADIPFAPAPLVTYCLKQVL